MLKEVMLGAGGIMLAAAIFASSVTPPGAPAPAQPVPAAAGIATSPPVVAPAAPSVQAPVAFPEDTGDTVFGAPMIEAAPVDTASDAAQPADPGSSDESGGRQFNARPGRAYPIPR